jgi:hypothetical protein
VQVAGQFNATGVPRPAVGHFVERELHGKPSKHRGRDATAR